MLFKDYYGNTHEAVYVRDIARQYDDKGYVFNHGLNAFCQDSDDNCKLSAVENNLNKLFSNDTMEICCSYTSQHVGSIGVELEGTCLLAATTDLNSRIDRENDNKRVVYKDMLQYIHEGSLEEISCGDFSYGEAIVTSYKVKRLWCNPYTARCKEEAREILMEAKRIAAKYNLELSIVNY